MAETTSVLVQGSRTLPVGKRIREYLDEHPEQATHPKAIAEAVGVPEGSAKRESKAWRDSQKLALLSPVYIQRYHLVTRTPPETVCPGSPPPGWQDRGDNKLTKNVDLPPDGHLEVRWSPNGTVEVVVASPTGFTASEILQALSFAKALLTLATDAVGTLSFEALRDGGSLTLDGLQAVTLRTAEAMLLKLYRNSDRRGESLRMEVRTPPMKYTLREAEALLLNPPSGRDSSVERLAVQVEEATKGLLWVRREILHMRKAVDRLRGS